MIQRPGKESPRFHVKSQIILFNKTDEIWKISDPKPSARVDCVNIYSYVAHRFYLQYKSIKALLKHDELSVGDFECLLQAEIKKIEDFYVNTTKKRLDNETTQKLQKFAQDNSEAIRKICKKWDKKHSHGKHFMEEKYTPPTIDGKPCAFVVSSTGSKDETMKTGHVELDHEISEGTKNDQSINWSGRQEGKIGTLTNEQIGNDNLTTTETFGTKELFENRDQDIALFFKSVNCKDPQVANEAIKNGKLQSFKALLENGTPWEDEYLLSAIKSKDLNVLVYALDIAPRIDPHLLIIAVKMEKHAPLIVMLDSQKFQMNAVDAESESAFYHACKMGNVQLARLLMEYGADPLQKELSNGWSPLMIAIIGGHQELVRALFPASHESWLIEDARGWLPIEHAVYRGHIWIQELAPAFNPANSSKDTISLNSESFSENEFGLCFLEEYDQLHIDITSISLHDLAVSSLQVLFNNNLICEMSVENYSAENVIIDLKDHKFVHFMLLDFSKNILGRSILWACEQSSMFKLCVPEY